MSTKKQVTGIIWVGPVYDWSGYGTVSRNYLQGLIAEKYPVRVISVGPKNLEELGSETSDWVRRLEHTDVGRYPVVVINLSPESYSEIWTFGAAKRIGISCFETDRIPSRWVQGIKKVDEAWVPSEFNVMTYSGSGVPRRKLWALPYAMDLTLYNPAVLPKRVGSGKPFTFLYIFSFGWRKGFDLLLESFLNEFKRGEARLILRAYTAGYQGVEQASLRDVMFDSVRDRVDFSRKDLPEVEIIDTSLSPDEMRKLYSQADLYISTDRANGWGMPCMEAMAMGIPAATIDGSGTMAFMNDTNSLLIKPTGKQVPVDRRLSDALPRLYGGHRWAEVEAAEVQRVMRWAIDHPKELKRLAKQGETDIREHFNPPVVAARITQHITSYRVGLVTRIAAVLGLNLVVKRVTLRRDTRDLLVTHLKHAKRRLTSLS